MAEIDDIIEQPSESEKRIKNLSDKVKTEAEAKQAAESKAAEAEAKTVEAEKRAAFAEGFADIVSENPAAKEFKTDIQAKVLSGYSMEDATFAVLGKAGKLGQPKVETQSFSAGGGSSATVLPQQGSDKTVGEMTQNERRAALEAAPDLMNILAPRSQR